MNQFQDFVLFLIILDIRTFNACYRRYLWISNIYIYVSHLEEQSKKQL